MPPSDRYESVIEYASITDSTSMTRDDVLASSVPWRSSPSASTASDTVSAAEKNGCDHVGVPLEDRVGEPDVEGGPRRGVRVDVGADRLEVVEAGEGVAERLLHRRVGVLDLLAEGGDRLVGVGARLVVAGDRHGHRGEADQLDRGPGPLVLERPEQAGRPDRRPGDVGLAVDLVHPACRLGELEGAHDGQRREWQRQGARQLQANRDSSQPAPSPGARSTGGARRRCRGPDRSPARTGTAIGLANPVPPAARASRRDRIHGA